MAGRLIRPDGVAGMPVPVDDQFVAKTGLADAHSEAARAYEQLDGPQPLLLPRKLSSRCSKVDPSLISHSQITSTPHRRRLSSR